MPKQNKIIACVCTDDTDRRRMMQRLIINRGFALTPGDANKLIKTTSDDVDLNEAYFVFVSHFNFNTSPFTTHKLYRLAVMGILVIVGVKRLQPQAELMCEVYNQGDV